MILQDLIDELGGSLVQGDKEWMVDGVNSCEKAGAFDVAFADSDATVAAALAGNAGVSPEEAAKEWTANVVPGITIIPSGTWGVNRAQEAGCTYCAGG